MVSARETSSRRHRDLSGGRSGTATLAGDDLGRAGPSQLVHSTQQREGDLKLAAPLPGNHRNNAGDEHRGGGEATASGYRFRKREREGRARRGAETHPRRVGFDGEAGGELCRRESLGGAHQRWRRERDGSVDSGSFTSFLLQGAQLDDAEVML